MTYLLKSRIIETKENEDLIQIQITNNKKIQKMLFIFKYEKNKNGDIIEFYNIINNKRILISKFYEESLNLEYLLSIMQNFYETARLLITKIIKKEIEDFLKSLYEMKDSLNAVNFYDGNETEIDLLHFDNNNNVFLDKDTLSGKSHLYIEINKNNYVVKSEKIIDSLKSNDFLSHLMYIYEKPEKFYLNDTFFNYLERYLLKEI